MVQRKFRCRSGAAWLAAVGAVLASGCPVARQLPTGELPLPVIERTAAKPPLTGDGAAAAAGEGEPAYGHKAEIDFEQENGKIFQNWPRPKLALLFSAKLDGYIEPCGCTGLENQKGGLSRRHSLILQLEKQGWTLLNLDAGGIVRRLGPQAAIKYQRAIDALKTMNYRAVGFGIRELTLPTEELLATLP
ncbi:MAG: hypothetical protein GTO03_04275, partial [Planctomycetales bacterium]|nr:hypothetical protein [Planctomycetales bacterium]